MHFKESIANLKHLQRDYLVITTMSSSYKKLYRAVVNGNERLVNILLRDKKVDPNQDDSTENSILIMAICNSVNRMNVIKLLITNPVHPADPNRADWQGITPFIEAVKWRSTELVDLLLTECLVPVNINYQSITGVTALMAAISQRNVHLVEMLLNAGADPNLRIHYPISAHRLPL